MPFRKRAGEREWLRLPRAVVVLLNVAGHAAEGLRQCEGRLVHDLPRVQVSCGKLDLHVRAGYAELVALPRAQVDPLRLDSGSTFTRSPCISPMPRRVIATQSGSVFARCALRTSMSGIIRYRSPPASGVAGQVVTEREGRRETQTSSAAVWTCTGSGGSAERRTRTVEIGWTRATRFRPMSGVGNE